MNSSAIYTRTSSYPKDAQLGVQRQQPDCIVLATRLGFDVDLTPGVGYFQDNDVSASTRSKNVRKQYEELMRRAERGEFGAPIFYSTSPLVRKPTAARRSAP
jgi:DNA invertase Pin-like site-specific DNA recombinase